MYCNVGSSKGSQKARAPLQLQSPTKADGNVGKCLLLIPSIRALNLGSEYIAKAVKVYRIHEYLSQSVQQYFTDASIVYMVSKPK